MTPLGPYAASLCAPSARASATSASRRGYLASTVCLAWTSAPAQDRVGRIVLPLSPFWADNA